MTDPPCPIPPHSTEPELGQTTITYLAPVEVTVDLDGRTVLRVVVDDQFPLPAWPHAYEDRETVALAAEIAEEFGDEHGWPQWEVG